MKTIRQAITIPLQERSDAFKVLQVFKKIPIKKLAIAVNEEVRLIAFEDILYCKSTSNYTTIFTRSDKSYLCSKTLKEVESKLPQDIFFRIHQSYIVNLQCIVSLKKQCCELELENQLHIPFSVTKKSELYKLLGI
ncbi:MAG: LytTR family DNA-binding domain-containing protein [Bacteroidota bacterium]